MPLVDAGFPPLQKQSAHARLQQYGPTLRVIVGPFELPADPNLLKTKTVPALVDTGASESVIDERLAKELELVPVDKAFCSGVGGRKEHLIYLGRILAPDLEIEQYGRFFGAQLQEGGQEHEVLLGRDFLQKTILIYDGFRAQVTVASAKSI